MLRITRPVGRGVEGRDSVVVDGDVIRVAIAAVRLEGDDDLRPHAPDDPNESGHHFVGSRVDIRPRVGILGRAGHPRVAVAQEDQLAHPDRLRRATQLGLPHLAESLRRGAGAFRDLTDLATRRADQSHVCTGCGILGQCPTGAERFVIGVGKKGEQGLLHGAP